MSIRYAVNVTLFGNAEFDSAQQANDAAQKWLDRLAKRDDDATWEECDWQIVEVAK